VWTRALWLKLRQPRHRRAVTRARPRRRDVASR
jgi:hypothetical protein